MGLKVNKNKIIHFVLIKITKMYNGNFLLFFGFINILHINEQIFFHIFGQTYYNNFKKN